MQWYTQIFLISLYCHDKYNLHLHEHNIIIIKYIRTFYHAPKKFQVEPGLDRLSPWAHL